MELFDWINIPMLFLELFGYASDVSTPQEIAAIAVRNFYISFAIGFALFVLCLVLGGVALNKLAQKEGVKPSAAAYLPFANTYFAGKIAGEGFFFGVRMKRAGLYAMLCEIAYTLLEGVRFVLNLLLTRGEYIVLESVEGTELIQWSVNRSLIPAEKQWLYDVHMYGGYISYLFYFLMVIFLFVLFVALFRKYYARSPFLMTILCTIFPFRSFVLFAVRNNARIDYEEYMRRVYARRYGYPPQPPQGGGQANDPFADYKTEPPKGDDPFPDHSSDHKEDDDVFKDF